MEQLDAVKTLSAIAHGGRLTLIRCLIQAGAEGVAAGELARLAGIGPTTASAQLLVLANAGLVRSEREGRQVTYFACYGRMKDILEFLMLDCCGRQSDICDPVIRACCK